MGFDASAISPAINIINERYHGVIFAIIKDIVTVRLIVVAKLTVLGKLNEPIPLTSVGESIISDVRFCISRHVFQAIIPLHDENMGA